MVAIGKLTQRIISAYDQNNDGVINLKGLANETSRIQRDYMSFPDRDELIISKVSHRKLFEAADVNGDKKVTATELKAMIASFDENNDGKLKNRGPFWKRRGELRNFDKAYGEVSTIVDRRVIYKPQPPHHNPYPGHPGGLPPGFPPGGFPRAHAIAAVGSVSLSAA